MAAKEKNTSDWKELGKALLWTFVIIMLVEFFINFFGLPGGNIIRLILGRALV